MIQELIGILHMAMVVILLVLVVIQDIMLLMEFVKDVKLVICVLVEVFIEKLVILVHIKVLQDKRHALFVLLVIKLIH